MPGLTRSGSLLGLDLHLLDLHLHRQDLHPDLDLEDLEQGQARWQEGQWVLLLCRVAQHSAQRPPRVPHQQQAI